SVAVYSTGLKEGPFRGGIYVPLQSSNPTETWKKAEEIMGQHYATRTGMEGVFMRIGGVYGAPYRSMGKLPSRMTPAAVNGAPVNYGGGPRGGGVPCEEDGGDICYVKDCALGIQLLIIAETLNHRVYNVSSGVTVTNRQLANAVRQAVPEAQIELRAGQGPGWRPHNYLDITRLTADTGYKPQYTVETAIADYVGWLRSGHEA